MQEIKKNGGPPSGDPPDITATMSLKYFVGKYVKPFKDNPNVLEVPFKELKSDGWKYNSNEKRFILLEKKK